MDLRDDLEKWKSNQEQESSTCNVRDYTRDYIRMIWKETTFSGEQFSNLNDFENLTMIKNRLISLIQKENDISDFRKKMYQRFLEVYLKESQTQFLEWLRYLKGINIPREEKWNNVARFLTKVICGDMIKERNDAEIAMKLMNDNKFQSAWEQYMDILNNLCKAKEIK